MGRARFLRGVVTVEGDGLLIDRIVDELRTSMDLDIVYNDTPIKRVVEIKAYTIREE